MATRNVVPRADEEGGIGTTLKRWVSAFLSGFLEFTEIAAPANPAANRAKIYAKDNGAGVTKMYMLDSAGAESDMSAGGSDLWDGTNLYLNKTLFATNYITMDAATGDYVFYKAGVEVFRI